MAVGQEKNLERTYIKNVLATASAAKADSLLTLKLQKLRQQKLADSLLYYITVMGYVKEKTDGLDASVTFAERLFKEVLPQLADPFYRHKAYMELAEVYDNADRAQLNHESTLKALEEAKKVKDSTLIDFGHIYYNLGIQAVYLGDHQTGKKYQIKALKYYQQQPFDIEHLFNSYNGMGIVMWNEAKMDSSYYYFNMALETLQTAKDTLPLNNFYRPAMLQSNMAVLQQARGFPEESITLSKKVIEDYEKYIAISTDVTRKRSAIRLLGSSIDNLAVFYNGIGHYQKADEIIERAFKYKKEHLDEDDTNLMISHILVAQSKISLREFEAAQAHLNAALQRIEKYHIQQPYWEASAYMTLATVQQNLGNVALAEAYYLKALPLQKQAFGETYNRDFLIESYRAAHFFATNDRPALALKIIRDTDAYIKSTHQENSLLYMNQLQAMGDVYYALDDYEKALDYGEKGLELIRAQQAKNPIDSVYVSTSTPALVLLAVKSRYKLAQNKSKDFLEGLMQQINTGLNALERRKALFTDAESFGSLLDENEDLIEFAKQIQLHLYNRTKDKKYLNNILTLHESALYSRIRSRLTNSSTRFAGLSPQLREQEIALKQQLNDALDGDNNLEQFFKHQQAWNNHIERLKQEQPSYYKLRYANLYEGLNMDRVKPKKGYTTVRYLFIEDKLYALVVTATGSDLIPLNHTEDKAAIVLPQNTMDPRQTMALLHTWYTRFWQPLEASITTQKVTIIPDRALFNISFESLLKEVPPNPDEAWQYSLIHDYIFSYNYSFLIEDQGQDKVYANGVTAFAPVFSSKLKSLYGTAGDVMEEDKDYLTLLSQPFSGDLVKELKQMMGARIFMEEEATKENFLANAKENTVLHIGTHASSNNLRPEFSQLVFAKGESPEADNILYANEIYETTMNSQLTVLTACETGKPGYKPGEGMISLAHAFNYAGSQSLLTSLWEIDEESSSSILKDFYEYIEDGNTKDVALHRAKMDYLQSHDGRLRAPQYWAGLVVMGDLSAVEVPGNGWGTWWTIGLIALLSVAVVFFVARGKNKG
ncbi:MAG: hypothetical protein CL868_18900 [Cytophagaceae bacterium]|nr:hypothetical protein [Cytophagaceae bacterium]|tara:strand:- start:111 stop:3266 length:3156 start_codon:yes stop_codon:yes gene_type:complete